jgi:hypothetical protein
LSTAIGDNTLYQCIIKRIWSCECLVLVSTTAAVCAVLRTRSYSIAYGYCCSVSHLCFLVLVMVGSQGCAARTRRSSGAQSSTHSSSAHGSSSSSSSSSSGLSIATAAIPVSGAESKSAAATAAAAAVASAAAAAATAASGASVVTSSGTADVSQAVAA